MLGHIQAQVLYISQQQTKEIRFIMKGPLAVAVVAALVMYASASPCTDMCNGACGAAKAACDLTGIFGALCNTNANLCNMGCGAICNCVDTCDAQCGEELAKCQSGADLLGAATCPFQYEDCQAMCGFQCAVGTASSAIDGLEVAPPVARKTGDITLTKPSSSNGNEPLSQKDMNFV